MVNKKRKTKIVSFRDLEVYQDSYKSCLTVHRDIIPKLPKRERFDLVDQLSRASKAIPRLIAEGYAKRHQRAGFQRYLDDAMAECNEIIVCLEQIKDIYRIEVRICDKLIAAYDKTGRQLYRLSQAWTKFKTKGNT